MIVSYPYWRNKSHTQLVCPGFACSNTEAQAERVTDTGQFTVNEYAHETALKMMSKDTKQNMGAVANGMLTLSCGVVAVRVSSCLEKSHAEEFIRRAWLRPLYRSLATPYSHKSIKAKADLGAQHQSLSGWHGKQASAGCSSV